MIKKVKIGDCITINNFLGIKEGVVTDIADSFIDVLWFSIDKRDNKYYFYRSTELLKEICNNYELSPTPHFCSIQNLYQNFLKFLKTDTENEVQLLGMNKINKESIITYFRINEMYLEIGCLLSEQYLGYNDLNYVYINESYNLNSLNINSDLGFYYIPLGTGKVVFRETNTLDLDDLFEILNTDDIYKNKVLINEGIVFFDKNNEYMLSFLDIHLDSFIKRSQNGFRYDSNKYLQYSKDKFLDKMNDIINIYKNKY